MVLLIEIYGGEMCCSFEGLVLLLCNGFFSEVEKVEVLCLFSMLKSLIVCW